MNEYYIAWWNLENLFDVYNSRQRPDWLRKALKKELEGWTEGILELKIRQLGSIIKKMCGGNGPDLLGVCEVENKPVLNQLVAELSDLGRDYQVKHYNTRDKRGIDVAFIFDANKFTAEQDFSHVILKRTATRDLYQVNFKTTSGRTLMVVGNHWPSRSGGEFESEPYRILAGETLSYWNQRILEEQGKDAAVLIMGDLNDEPFNRSVMDYALATNSRQKVLNANTPRVYNLSWPLLGEGVGTFYFDNFPNVLDQVLVSRGVLDGSSGFSLEKLAGSDHLVKIETFPEMVSDGDYPAPKPFGRPSEELDTDGFSDHFPISVVLKEE